MIDRKSGTWPDQTPDKKRLIDLFHIPKKEASFKVVTWNVGTTRDYSNMRHIKHSLDEGMSVSEAYQKLLSRPYRPVAEQEMRLRIPMIANTIGAFGKVDLICMQESWQIENLREIFPKQFGYYSFANESGREGLVAWNRRHFRFLKAAALNYDPHYVSTFDTAPDTIVLLEHLATQSQVCVTSAHLRGFALTDERLSEHQKMKQTRKAHAGNNQACYNRDTMAQIDADLYLFAGDYNVTPEHYPKRLQLLEDVGYIRDTGDTRPTIYDATLRESDGVTPLPVKLDYIHVRSPSANIVGFDPLQKPIEDFENRPSDHLPVAATISFFKRR